MIQQKYKNSVQETSGQVQTTGFSIEVNESMFQMLTSNVYNDPMLAVIREWSTNACDACIAAGKEVKFDVHLPTLEESKFSVRDYGTGLAPEDISGLFSSLGASTKRSSNAYNGTFGIGRMAGLAVSNAFTVESFYNGKLHSYVISMQNGVPVTIHMGDSDTDEPNGLRLSVAVDNSDINNYLTKAQYLYRYFDHKPNLNRDDIDIHLKVEEHISEDWFIQTPENAYSRTNYVVMSQVPYAIPEDSRVDNQGFRNLVIRAPAGAVSFNPGRESLSLDKETAKFLNETFEKIADDYVTAATISMANATNDIELMTTYKALYNTAPSRVKTKLSPDKFTSQLYKNLYGAMYYGNPTPTYQYLMVTDTFCTDTNHILSLSYKEQYYKTSKTISKNDPISWQNFFYAHHVVVDLKTKFRSALNEAFNGKSLVTWQRTDKGDLEEAVEHAKRYLDEMGIPYKLASELVDTTEVKAAAPREGLYVSDLNGTTMARSTKMEEEDITKGTYLYLKTKNNTPQISKDNKFSFNEYVNAYRMLGRVVPDLPPVKGVAKKYQGFVDDLDNWVDFQSYIEETMAAQTFKVHSDVLPIVFRHNLIHLDNVDRYPQDIQEYYGQVLEYTKYVRSPNFLINDESKDLAEQFGATLESYEWPEDHDPASLKEKYKTTLPLLDGRQYQYGLDSGFVVRVANLEDFYATHSSE